MVLDLFLQRRSDGAFELLHIIRHIVGKVRVFRVAPHRLDGIEFLGVRGQQLEFNVLQPRGVNLFGGRAMHAPAVPADNQRTSQLLTQLPD